MLQDLTTRHTVCDDPSLVLRERIATLVQLPRISVWPTFQWRSLALRCVVSPTTIYDKYCQGYVGWRGQVALSCSTTNGAASNPLVQLCSELCDV